MEDSLLSEDDVPPFEDAVGEGQERMDTAGADEGGILPHPPTTTTKPGSNIRTVRRRERRQRAKVLRAGGVPPAPKSNDDLATTTTTTTATTTTATTATGSREFPSTPATSRRGGEKVKRVNLHEIDPTLKNAAVGSSVTTTNNNKKRGRSTPASNNPREKKRPSTYRDAVIEGSEVVINYKDDPHRPLSKDDQEAIRRGLRSAIDAAAATTLLKFGGIVIRGGGIIITCRDPTSKLWVEGEVEKLGGGKFATGKPGPSELEVKVSFWVREETSPQPQVLFPTISRLNQNMDTTTWRMTHSVRSGQGFVCFCRIPKSGVAALKPPAQFNYYFDELVFRVTETPLQN